MNYNHIFFSITLIFSAGSLLGCKKNKSTADFPVKVIYLMKTSATSQWNGFITEDSDSISKLFSIFKKSRKSPFPGAKKLKRLAVFHWFRFYGKQGKLLYSFSIRGNDYIVYNSQYYFAWDLLLTTNILLHRNKFKHIEQYKVKKLLERP